MKKIIDLAGPWDMCIDQGEKMPGYLPGSNYLTLMTNGMEDPFFGTNEKWATQKGHHDHTFSRSFTLTREEAQSPHLDFVGDGIDTIANIFVNGRKIGSSDNLNRTWRFDMRSCAKEGENEIVLAIQDPYKYMLSKQAGDSHLGKPGKEKSFIRKAPCHFGWDWGPELAPSGVIRSIGIETYIYRIEETKIRQHHQDGKVLLDLWMCVNEESEDLSARIVLTSPSKEEIQEVALIRKGNTFTGQLEVKNPQLWWVAGLGEQPLYDLSFILFQNAEPADEVHKTIGLRTIKLDTAKDPYGEQFRFVINGVPIFIRGADWIPSDSFITRFSREDMEFYIKATRDSGMNMLRIWGGGMYESEDFYDMCDKYGILVWQDFIFACALYPFYRSDFLQNVCEEVKDNVRRIRHRASLALWCGNNEIDALYPVCRDKALLISNKDFFYLTLRDWVNELDGITPYWPGSPSSGHINKGPQNFRKGHVSGDSHLWNIWHGMLPIEAYRNYPTRFCSEFGMESMPAMKTIRRISHYENPELFDDVMLLHQKSGGGNSKIMYYLLQKYRRPKHFEDFVYLSQIVQSNAMRFATECWKRNIGMQNGATLWQLNDCWPVASWSIIDYYKQYKATMYHSRHYNKMLMISNDYYDDRAELYVINEYPKPFSGTLKYEIKNFQGQTLLTGKEEVRLEGVSSKRIYVLSYKGLNRSDVYLKTVLYQGEELMDEKLYLLVPDKDASLKKPVISRTIQYDGGNALVTLESDTLARYVYIDSDLIWDNWSDNYFDLEPGRKITVCVPLKDVSPEKFEAALTIKSLMDVEPYGTPEDDRKYMKEMWKKDKNWATYYAYKLVMAILWAQSIGD